HVDTQSNVLVTNALRANINVNTTPGVGPAAAVAAAVAALRLRGPYQASLPSLMILPRGDRSPVDLLVWRVQVMASNTVDSPTQWEAFVDARNGSLLWAYNSLESGASTATGNTMYSGQVTLNVDYEPIVTPSFV